MQVPMSEGGEERTNRTRWEKLRPLPIWMFLGITVACLVLKEEYPLTNNPMYASLPPRVRYFYVTDQDGEVIPFRKVFGYSLIDVMKKMKVRRKSLMKEAGVSADKEEDILRFEKEALDPLMAWYFKNRRPKDEYKGKPIPYESLTVVRVLATRENRDETPLGTVNVNGESEN